MRVAVACLWFVAVQCLAAGDWVRVNGPGFYWEYDRSSVTTSSDGTRRMLARFTLDTPLQDKGTGAYYDHAIYTYEIDCPKRMVRVVDLVIYFRAERVQPSRTSEDWRAGADNTLYKAACG
jgi:hypothetical protein